ncbi:MAG: hypothetical protein OXH38_01220 [Chloroflexi bacterium]|nr:hypothetical protein [Chloroflexota bacterium]
MALCTIDKLRFRNILVRGQLPEKQAVEFVDFIPGTGEIGAGQATPVEHERAASRPRRIWRPSGSHPVMRKPATVAVRHITMEHSLCATRARRPPPDHAAR